MKICTKCARSFADGFAYCPQDATALVAYDLRADLPSRNEPRFLLESESLARRLRRELGATMTEMRRDPRGCLTGLLRGEGSNRRRRRLLQAGVATAVIAYGSAATLTLLIGLLTGPVAERVADAKFIEKPDENAGALIIPAPIRRRNADGSHAGMVGGSHPRPARAHGGGGQLGPAAARSGAPPAAAPIQLLKPNLDPVRFHATVVTPMTVVADPAALLRMNARLGVIGGAPNSNALGNSDGTGIGPGNGPGVGPGRNGNTGKGDNLTGGGPTEGTENGPQKMSARLRPTILYKEKASYTEEARQQRIQGTVMLAVTFGADGRIHDVRVVRGLPAGLTEKAIEAAQRIRFQPAVQNGRPVGVRGNLEFHFALY
ncbi:MAG: energy transducer TonB [Blastocatellia bacterium]|nr:energy transducer TonB [Blastocatellia bacterium]